MASLQEALFDPVRIGYNLKLLREARGLSVTKVAEEIDRTASTIYKYEESERLVSLGDQFKFAALYGVDMNTLLDFENNTQSVDSRLGRLNTKDQSRIRKIIDDVFNLLEGR